MKYLLLMSLRQKAEKVNWEEVGTNATYLPLLYMAVMAPGFLALLGFCCFVAMAVGEFPSGLKVGSCLIACGLILVCIYRSAVKYQFKKKKMLNEEKPPVSLPVSASARAIAPFLKQFHDEQKLLWKNG